MQLTSEQAAIISHQGSHAKVVAVAGSGKTTTLCEFIAAKIEQGIPAKRLLVLMYNRSTREDFQQRLRQRLPGQPQADIRTFHALGYKLYQALIQRGALPPIKQNPLSQGQFEQQLWRLLLAQASSELRQEMLNDKQTWLEPALSFFEQVKACLDTPEVVFQRLKIAKKLQCLIAVFHQFEHWRKQQQQITYADMLYDPAMAFKQNPLLAQQFSGHMQYILVDEYQDINHTQQFLLDVLLAKRGYLMAVGDPEQTIYEFRGSQPEFMQTTFAEKYPQHQSYDLSYSFRYGHQTALASNYLLRQQQAAHPSALTRAHPNNPATDIKLLKYDEQNPLAQIQGFKTLLEKLRDHYELKDIAVLTRLWAAAAQIELFCLQENIPYQLEHNISVLQRHELKPFFLLFNFAEQSYQQQTPQQKQQSWYTLLTQPYPKIKKNILEAIAQSLASCNSGFGRHFYQHAQQFELSQWQQDQISQRLSIIDQAAKNPKACKLVSQWLNVGDYLEFLTDSGFSRQQSDDQVATVKAFAQFLNTLSIKAGDIRTYLQQKQQDKQQSSQALVLSSIHKAKGLEWPVVIMPSVNQYFYPYINESEPLGKAEKDKIIAAERRLLYVAMTRAKKALFIFTPKQVPQQSPLLRECRFNSIKSLMLALESKQPRLFLNTADLAIAQQYCQLNEFDIQLQAQQASAGSNPGSELVHKRFGVGTLIAENQDYFTIRFQQGGTKKLKKSIAEHHIQWAS